MPLLALWQKIKGGEIYAASMPQEVSKMEKIEPNEITEDIIECLRRFSNPTHFHGLKFKLELENDALRSQLLLLSIHDVAEYRMIGREEMIVRLPKFNNVLKAGGLAKYLEQKALQEKNDRERSDLEFELKKKQVQDLDIRLANVEKQFKEQSEFWKISRRNTTIALIISCLGLIVSLLVLWQKTKGG